jgi:hypothetical protein
MPRDGANLLSDIRVPVLTAVCEPCGRCPLVGLVSAASPTVVAEALNGDVSGVRRSSNASQVRPVIILDLLPHDSPTPHHGAPETS